MELSEAIEKPRVNNVFLRKGPRLPQPGALALIGHHLIFSPSDAKKKKTSEELWVISSFSICAEFDFSVFCRVGCFLNLYKMFHWSSVVWFTAKIFLSFLSKTTQWFKLLHRAVDFATVEPKSRDNVVKGGFLILKCKNFMICEFEMDDLEDCMAVARSIQRLSNLSNVTSVLQFQ